MKQICCCLLICFFTVLSCEKPDLQQNQFIGQTGGIIQTPDYIIEVPKEAMPEGYFIEENKSKFGFSDYGEVTMYLLNSNDPAAANKQLLSTNTFVTFESSKTNTEKPLRITMSYFLCDNESSNFCGLSDTQAVAYALNKKDFVMQHILSDSLNYLPVPLIARDTVNKTVTFETTDLTKIYLIAREL